MRINWETLCVLDLKRKSFILCGQPGLCTTLPPGGRVRI